MTCVECKYQWCWVCSGKYTNTHFETGRCAGLQHAQISVAPTCFSSCSGRWGGTIIAYWFFTVGFSAGFTYILFLDYLASGIHKTFLYIFAYGIILCYNICFQIYFTVGLSFTIIPILCYWPLLDIITSFGLNIGEEGYKLIEHNIGGY